jgi:hypothetical protein
MITNLNYVLIYTYCIPVAIISEISVERMTLVNRKLNIGTVHLVPAALQMHTRYVNNVPVPIFSILTVTEILKSSDEYRSTFHLSYRYHFLRAVDLNWSRIQ